MTAMMRIRNENGEYVDIPALVGPRGPTGPKGDTGERGSTGERGPKGDQGDSGVHVGSEEPTGDVNVWINPNGEATDLEGEYELIERFVTAGEDVIERTKEPDGTDYKFEAILVKMIGQPASSNIGVNEWMFSNGQRIGGGYHVFTNTTSVLKGAVEVYKHRGYWRSENHVQNTSSTAYGATTLGGDFYTLKYPTKTNPYITSWMTNSEQPFPANITIEIWAVRA